MKRYQMNLKILSPVHIGSGETLDPLEYAIEEGLFYRLDLTRFVNRLAGNLKREFLAAADEMNPIQMRKFIVDNFDPRMDALSYAAAAEPFVEAYRRNLQNPHNQLVVNVMTRTGIDYRMYIPGSSIKGAIRTAVVSTLAKQKHVPVSSIRHFETKSSATGMANKILSGASRSPMHHCPRTPVSWIMSRSLAQSHVATGILRDSNVL